MTSLSSSLRERRERSYFCVSNYCHMSPKTQPVDSCLFLAGSRGVATAYPEIGAVQKLEPLVIGPLYPWLDDSLRGHCSFSSNEALLHPNRDRFCGRGQFPRVSGMIQKGLSKRLCDIASFLLARQSLFSQSSELVGWSIWWKIDWRMALHFKHAVCHTVILLWFRLVFTNHRP